jgi:hypothetical protein
MSAFTSTLNSFCAELRLTFPELEAQVARAATTTPTQFWKSWQENLDILLLRDADALHGERKGFLVGAVRLTPAVWAEVSPTTHAAIWKYLRTLVLESAMTEELDTEKMQKLVDILTAERVESPGGFEETMKPMLERLKSMMGSPDFMKGFMDSSAGFTMPEIPERLRNGRIAKMAEEMAKQFDPSEFGIDPALLKGDNIEEILTRLAELYQRDPTLLIGGAKKMADRIKKQILGGSLNREELIAEAQEFIALFKEHPMFKEMLGKFNDMMGPGGIGEMFGSSNSAAPSERRRAVQERLRKKMAARQTTNPSS